MTEFHSGLGTSLQYLWTMSDQEGLAGTYDPPFTFDSSKIDAARSPNKRVPFDFNDYLDGMSVVTALQIATVHRDRRIAAFGRVWDNTAGEPPVLVLNMARDADKILTCQMLAIPRTVPGEPRLGISIVRVPMALPAADRENTLSQEFFAASELQKTKDLIDAVGGLITSALLLTD